jgi:DNA-binding transcriptional MerR regulator
MVRIGEAAQAAGMTSKALRFYEEHGLLPAAKRTANGYRDYTGETVNRLDFIRRGRAAGLALAQIREILLLRDAGRAPCTHVRDLLAGQLAGLDAQIAELVAHRRRLPRGRGCRGPGGVRRRADLQLPLTHLSLSQGRGSIPFIQLPESTHVGE